jgi:hypothetical protein
MFSVIRLFVVVFILPVFAIAILKLDTYASQKSRFVYRVSLVTEDGGPVRAVALPGIPVSLRVRSTPELDAESQARLGWHFRNAALLAEQFATLEGVRLTRQTVPDRVEIYDSPKSLAEGMFMPETEYGWQAVARVDLNAGVVCLGRSTSADLYVELGKWFLYPARYRWGQDQKRDMNLLKQAERFASFCLDEQNWIEEGGSTKQIW